MNSTDDLLWRSVIALMYLYLAQPSCLSGNHLEVHEAWEQVLHQSQTRLESQVHQGLLQMHEYALLGPPMPRLRWDDVQEHPDLKALQTWVCDGQPQGKARLNYARFWNKCFIFPDMVSYRAGAVWTSYHAVSILLELENCRPFGVATEEKYNRSGFIRSQGPPWNVLMARLQYSPWPTYQQLYEDYIGAGSHSARQSLQELAQP